MSASQSLTKEEQEALGVRPTGTTPGAGNPAPTRRQSSPSIPARVVSGVLASRRGGTLHSSPLFRQLRRVSQ